MTSLRRGVGELLNGKPKKPTEDPYKYIDKNGEPTSEGKTVLKMFIHECLVPDEDALLDVEDLHMAFDQWSDRPGAFPSLGQSCLSYTGWSELIGSVKWHFRLSGAPSDVVFSTESVRTELRDGYICGYRARFVDALGATAFNPDVQGSTAVEYLVDGLFALDSVNMFVAKPGSVKTWLGYRVAIDVSQGRPVLDASPRKELAP